MNYIVLRNNIQFEIPLWQLLSNDIVLATDGNFLPVMYYPELRKFFPQLQPPQPMLSDVLHDIGIGLIVGAGIVLLAGAVIDLLTPQYNDKPLTQGLRTYVRARDNEFCFYCEDYAPKGHVDHRISRANGGGNEPENLAWSCAPCNLRKGAMNDYEFLGFLQ